MAEIVLDQVSKRFADGTTAIHEASLTIRDGEFFVLVGPSGCGKSTLLQMIVGLEKVTAGRILVDGQVVNDLDPRDRNMAMVFQSYAIYPHMTVRENLAFPLKIAKLSKEEIRARVEDTAAILGLAELLGRKPGSLSGGQRQRVAMGRAMVRQPRAFLLDEPLSNLDPILRAQMRTELARIQDRLGTTTLYVTHDQTEAMTLGDRVAVLRGGKVQQIGTPKELYSDPCNRFVAGFIGAPAMNLLPARVDGARLVLPMTAAALTDAVCSRLPKDCGEVIVGIRPEHFRELDPGLSSHRQGFVFKAAVELVEWLGAEIHAYFSVGGSAPVRPRDRHEGIRPPPGERIPVVARLAAASRVARSQELELWVDERSLLFFHPRSGERLA